MKVDITGLDEWLLNNKYYTQEDRELIIEAIEQYARTLYSRGPMRNKPKTKKCVCLEPSPSNPAVIITHCTKCGGKCIGRRAKPQPKPRSEWSPGVGWCKPKPTERVSDEDFVRVCEFLAKEGYLGDDWWAEEPTALERYKEAK